MAKHNEAENLHRKVVNDSQKVLGAGHPFNLISYCNLGSVLHAQAKYEEAELAHPQALSKRREVLGMKHPHTLSSLHNLTLTLNGLSKSSEATTLMERCLRLKRQTLGTIHPDAVKSCNNLSEWTGLTCEDTNEDTARHPSSTSSSKQHDITIAHRLFALGLIGAMTRLLLLVQATL